MRIGNPGAAISSPAIAGRSIATSYNNRMFRSRLEARWAVFFDALGYSYEYEPEGFNLGDGIYYLPDFRITVTDTNGDKSIFWLEVKPRAAELPPDQQEKISRFAQMIEGKVGAYGDFILLDGEPSVGKDKWHPSVSLGIAGYRWFMWSTRRRPWLAYEAQSKSELRYEYRAAVLSKYQDTDGDSGQWNAPEAHYLMAVKRALSARFEHGESPISAPIFGVHRVVVPQ